MNNLRKAAEMAATDLEELIHWHGVRDSDDKLMPAHNQTPEIKSAIESLDALRQALAQPQEWKTCRHCGFQYRPPKEDKWHPLAQPEQKPVRWINFNAATGQESIDDYCDSELASIPLYTAPPKREWKGLTVDDKHFLLANAWNKEQAFDGFMDAIDKFLEEKNT